MTYALVPANGGRVIATYATLYDAVSHAYPDMVIILAWHSTMPGDMISKFEIDLERVN